MMDNVSVERELYMQGLREMFRILPLESYSMGASMAQW
ncbi:hypothetical protein BN938_2109 [Mucinivorans hirudinis]|uniref:Uncharacterized protein n=1 Tax=Mucinivorans hirudinis TaxID=1433126 RepID=A0A060R9C9_9BACT|nr:hypothetical protein BN938_2109 [Mucinivorans hirudinis]